MSPFQGRFSLLFFLYKGGPALVHGSFIDYHNCILLVNLIPKLPHDYSSTFVIIIIPALVSYNTPSTIYTYIDTLITNIYHHVCRH